MTKTFLKFSAICVAGSLSASVWAQNDSQNSSTTEQNKPANSLSSDQSARSWSTKRLSATGRDSDHCIRASTLTGAPVSDSAGQRVGQIQDIIINPTTGRIDFITLSLNSENNNGGKTIPVPWPLLRTSSSSQYAGTSEQHNFTLNVERSKLVAAPSVDWAELSKSEQRQRIYSYYGVTPQSMGGAESPSGKMQGEGARQQQTTPPPALPQNP